MESWIDPTAQHVDGLLTDSLDVHTLRLGLPFVGQGSPFVLEFFACSRFREAAIGDDDRSQGPSGWARNSP